MRGTNRILAIVFVLLISLGYPAKSGAVEFAPPKTYPAGTNPLGVVVADFNGDGKPDLAVANSGSNNVSILLGNGDGTFQAAVNFDAGLSPNSIAVGDFNGDGKLDLAVFRPGDSSNNIAGIVGILLGNGDGTFQAAKTTNLTIQAASMVVGDFNSDKKSDMVIGDIDQATDNLALELFIGNGDGSFLTPRLLSTFSNGTGALLATDLNSDGRLDLAVGSTAAISILLGNGDGTFQQASGTSVTISYAPLSILAGDLRGSGKQDFIVKSFHRSSIPNCREFCISSHQDHISVFLSNGDGSFQGEQIVASATNIPPALGLGPIALGNLNADKKLDLINSRTSSSSAGLVQSFEVRLGRGDGTFSNPVVLDATGISLALTDDLNADQLNDLVAFGGSNDVAVLLNSSPTSGADLGIIRTSATPSPIGEGTSLTYTADALNEGPTDATSVRFEDTLPNGVDFVSATVTRGTCTQALGIVSCSIGSLPDAAEVQVTIMVTPTAAGTISNAMSVSGAEPDLAPANNSATQDSTVLPVYTLTVAITGDQSGRITGSPAGLDGSTISCPGICSGRFLSGTVASLNNTDTGGKAIFTSWGGVCAGTDVSALCNLTMDSDKSVIANFVTGTTLNVNLAGTGSGNVVSDSGGISCGSSGGACGSALLLPGTSVSLTATPSGSSTFATWSGACTGTDPKTCKVTLNSDQSVTATFNILPDFTISPAATSLTVERGGQVSEVLTFGTQGGFAGSIALACSVSGPSPIPTCAISPASVTPGANATLTVNVAALSASLSAPWFGQGAKLYAALVPLGLFGCVLATGLDKKRRRMWALCLLVMTATILPAACGGGNSVPPPPVSQSYAVTVTATSGAIQHSTTISVTVK